MLIVDFILINNLIKECPQCHVQYDNLKNFCLNCVPPSKLQPIVIENIIVLDGQVIDKRIK